ncbi:hypothetical protein [Lacipirellula sp.]|uniref:hypothetical protein n=1 Tax=Lacipirellula sp. TaxID=2691419 RepID=UPI003D1515C7
MPSDDLTTYTTDDFFKEMKEAGRVLIGFVAYDKSYGDHILFGRTPLRCPRLKIPKSLITKVQLGAPMHCRKPDGGGSQMWFARVHLKSADSPEAQLAEALLDDIEAPSDSGDAHSCSCSGGSDFSMSGTSADMGEPTFELYADCVSVTIRNGKACLNVPVKGSVCVDVPSSIPNGTVAEACIKICKKFGIPCGVKVYVKVAGIEVASGSWGCC